MKKLRIYNHLGEKEKEFDVYLEGGDFSWIAAAPENIWLSSIVIEDAAKESILPTALTIPVEEFEPYSDMGQPITEEEAKEMQEEQLRDAAIEAKIAEEEARKIDQALEKFEQKELENGDIGASDKESDRDSGTSQADKLKDSEELPQNNSTTKPKRTGTRAKGSKAA